MSGVNLNRLKIEWNSINAGNPPTYSLPEMKEQNVSQACLVIREHINPEQDEIPNITVAMMVEGEWYFDKGYAHKQGYRVTHWRLLPKI